MTQPAQKLSSAQAAIDAAEVIRTATEAAAAVICTASDTASQVLKTATAGAHDLLIRISEQVRTLADSVAQMATRTETRLTSLEAASVPRLAQEHVLLMNDLAVRQSETSHNRWFIPLVVSLLVALPGLVTTLIILHNMR